MILKFAEHARGGEPLGLKIRTSSFEGFVVNPGGFPKGGGTKSPERLLCSENTLGLGPLLVYLPNSYLQILLQYQLQTQYRDLTKSSHIPGPAPTH